MEGYYIILDTPFNRENYPNEIGHRFENPPSYAMCISEKDEFAAMPVSQVVSLWNAIQLSAKRIRSAAAAEVGRRHTGVIASVLVDWGIPHKVGELIETVRVARAA